MTVDAWWVDDEYEGNLDEDVSSNIRAAFKYAFQSEGAILGEGEGMIIDMDDSSGGNNPIYNIMNSDSGQFTWTDSDDPNPLYLDYILSFVGLYAMNKDLQDSAGNYLTINSSGKGVSELLREEIEEILGYDGDSESEKMEDWNWST